MIRKIGLVLLASTTMLWPAQAIAMPQAIAGLVLPLVVNSPVFFLGPAAISAVAMGIGYAAVIGVAMLAQSALRPSAPKPEDVQTNFRQATPVRSALYGEGLLGGPWIFAGTTSGGFFHRIIALASRPLTAIDGIWIDDLHDVELDGEVLSGAAVVTPPYDESVSGAGWLRVEGRLGQTPSSHYSLLAGNFEEWTAQHRGDGIASLYTRFRGTAPEDIQKFWPNAINTLVRARCRGVAVWDPVSDDTGYSDNLARCILDYMRHADGFRIPDSLILTPMALEAWREAVADCDDAIALAAGGAEPRYRLWGVYMYNERPADVLTRYMAAGNARIKPVADGGFALEVGKWRAPTVTIDSSMITGFDSLARGRDVMQTSNTVNAQYTSVDHEYQATDAQPWIDEADVSERGEIPVSLDIYNAPSHGQCRRLMKIEAHRSNPAEVGTFTCNKAAIIAYGERFIIIDFPEMDVSGEFEVLDFQFVFGEHGILKGCSLTVQSIGQAAYDWNAETEEGEPGGTQNPPSDDPFAAPSGFDVTMLPEGEALIVWDEPSSSAFVITHIQVENLTDPDGTDDLFVAAEDMQTTISGLAADDEYRLRMRLQANVSATAWTGWITRTALA